MQQDKRLLQPDSEVTNALELANNQSNSNKSFKWRE